MGCVGARIFFGFFFGFGVFGVFWGGVFFFGFLKKKYFFGFFDFWWAYFLSFCLLLATQKIAFAHRSNFVHIHAQL